MTVDQRGEIIIAAPDYLSGRVVERRPVSDNQVNGDRFEVSLHFSQLGSVPNQEHLPEAGRCFTSHFEGYNRSNVEGLKLTIFPQGVRGAQRLMGKVITIIISDP